MRNSKFISFIALFVLALSLVFFSPPESRAADLNIKAAKATGVKFPPNVKNSFRAVRIAFVIESYSTSLPPLLRTVNKFLMAPNDFRGNYRIAFSPPILAKESYKPDKTIYRLLPTKRKPEIVRMM